MHGVSKEKSRLTSASYPDVSLDMRAKEGGKETTGACRLYPSHGPLRFITSHSFRARLCHAKNEAPEEEAASYFLFLLSWEHQAIFYNEFFSFLFLSLFQSFSRLFITSSSVSFLVFLLLFNRSASLLCSNSFRSPSVRSPASSALGEFTGKFTVYSSPRNRFLMELSTLRSI